MTTTVKLKKILDRQQWEVCTPCPWSNGQSVGTHYTQTPPRWPVPQLLYLSSNQPVSYDPRQDAWVEVTNYFSGVTFAAGSCAVFHPFGPTGTASAGTATTITTATTLNYGIEGHTIRLTGGTGAGQDRIISSNTLGANGVVTVSVAWSVTPDATTTYVLMTGKFWALGNFGGTVGWRVVDLLAGSNTAKSVVSVPSTWGTDAALAATSGVLQPTTIASGTATSGAASTLSNSGKAWTTNQWINFQVRLTGGTGAGQVRTVTANTGTALTVSVAWTVNPDATSTYVLEGNDDWIYLAGHNATPGFYRYAINGITGVTPAQATGDTWIALTSRPGSSGPGVSLSWICDSPDDRYATENTIQNGQKMFSNRGSSFNWDIYDIPTNTWTNDATFKGNLAVNFLTGSAFVSHLGNIYVQGNVTGRYYRFNVANNRLDSLAYLAYPHGTAAVGPGRLSLFSYVDGATEILFLYVARTGGNELFRLMLI